MVPFKVRTFRHVNHRGDFMDTTRRHFLRQSALLIGSGSLLAACGGSSGSGASATTVSVGLPAGGNSLSIWKPVIERRGLSADGVALKWVGGDPGQLQTQFLSGSVDISTFGPLGTALALLKGDEIAITGPGIYGHHKWLVRDDSRARSVADLRGKRVATGLATAEAFRATQLILAVQGASADDFTWVHSQGAAAVALFERGDVDAIYIGEPNATILVDGGARQIGSLQEEWASATGSELPLFNAGPTLRTKWLAEHPEAAAGAVGMLVGASTSVAEDPSQLTAVAPAIGVKPALKDVAAQLPERMGDVYMKAFGEAEKAQLDEIVALGVKHGLLPEAPAAKVYAELT
jgi:ABC-type nitrate/sulfonate/bicarbonate transport system substrate-binding protein